MAKRNKYYLVGKFENNDVPTGTDFSDFISSSLNLSETGSTVQTLSSSLVVSGTLNIKNDTTITGSTNIAGSTTIIGNTAVTGAFNVQGDISCSGNVEANSFTLQGHSFADVSSINTSGSVSFGDSASQDNHRMTGSLGLSGSSFGIVTTTTSFESTGDTSFTADEHRMTGSLKLSGSLEVSMSGNSYLNGARIGINTTTPSHTLEIKSDDGGIVDGSSIIAKFHGNYAGLQGLMVSRSEGASVKLLANYSSYGGGLESSDALRFSTNGNTLSNPSMYIETDGKVGIGNPWPGTSPAAELHISTSTNAPKILIEARSSSLPGLTANMEIKGFGGRAKGIFFSDLDNSDNRWFVGSPYHTTDNKDFQIGFSDASSNNLPHYHDSASVYIKRDFVSGSVNNLALVGINTDSPSSPLHIGKASNFGTIALSTLKSASFLVGTTSTGVGIDPNEIVFSGTTGHIGTITDHSLLFITNGSIRARFLGNGNFGIGNSDPENKLVVAGTISGSSNLYIKGMAEDTAGSFPNVVTYDTATGRFYYTGSYGSGGGGTDGIFAETGSGASAAYATTNNVQITGSLIVKDSTQNTTFKAQTITLTDDTDGLTTLDIINSTAIGISEELVTGAKLQLTPQGNNAHFTCFTGTDDASHKIDIGSTATHSYLTFSPGNGEKMRISTDGKVGIGRTAATYQLEVQGDMAATADVIAYLGSDRRLKDNIKPIENPIEKIKQIGGYTFDWNDNQSTYEGNDVGVIAQEIEKVLPSLVNNRKDGYKGVKYDKIVALLIEGIKDQQKQIDDLKAQINGSTK